MPYIEIGEYKLALEFLSDWCIDAEPAVTLNADEIKKFMEVSRLMDIAHPWVELFPLLDPLDIKNIPKELTILAREYIKNEPVGNPEREVWLGKIESIIDIAEKSRLL